MNTVCSSRAGGASGRWRSSQGLRAPVEAQAHGSATPGIEFFEKRCSRFSPRAALSCHGTTASGGLRLDSREALLKGGKSGPAIVVGDPDKSLLIAAVRHTGAIEDAARRRQAERRADHRPRHLGQGRRGRGRRRRPAPSRNRCCSDHFETTSGRCSRSSALPATRLRRAAACGSTRCKDCSRAASPVPALVPGDPDKSLLIAALRHSGPLKMPKGGTRLTDEQLDNFTTWIKDGAFWPAEKSVAEGSTPTSRRTSGRCSRCRSPRCRRSRTPRGRSTTSIASCWPGSRRKGSSRSPTADRRTLLRRVTYDLTGLMPTTRRSRRSRATPSPNAWEKVVDRLLASPRYGERWARHWMDVVRYGEDDYNVGEQPRSRREVSLRLPLSRLADSRAQRRHAATTCSSRRSSPPTCSTRAHPRQAHLPALGMNGNGIWIFHASPAPVERADEWHDKVDVTSKAFLGLTVGCARCHDHKYDAIYHEGLLPDGEHLRQLPLQGLPAVPKSVVDEYEKQNKVLREEEPCAARSSSTNASDLYAQMLFAQSRGLHAGGLEGRARRRRPRSRASPTRPRSIRSCSAAGSLPEEEAGQLPARSRTGRRLVATQGQGSGRSEDAQEARQGVRDQGHRHQREARPKLTKENEFTLAQVKGTPVRTMTTMRTDPTRPRSRSTRCPTAKAPAERLSDRSEEPGARRAGALARCVRADVPEIDGRAPTSGARRKPGLLKLTDGALERRLTADLKTHVDRARADIDAFKKAMPPQYPIGLRHRGGQDRADLKVFVRGNPYAFGEDAPRGVPVAAVTRAVEAVHARAADGMELAEEIIKPADRRARHRQPHLALAHRPRHRRHAEQLRHGRRDARRNPSCSTTWRRQFVEDGMSWKKLHKEILLSRTYQLSVDAGRRPTRRRMPITASSGAPTACGVEAEGVWDAPAAGRRARSTSRASAGRPTRLDREDEAARRLREGEPHVSERLPGDLRPADRDHLGREALHDQRAAAAAVLPEQRVVHKQAERLAERIKRRRRPSRAGEEGVRAGLPARADAEELAAALEFVTMEPMKPVTTANAAAARPDGGRSPDAPEADIGEKSKDDDKDAKKKLPDSPLRSFCWALLSSNEFLFID